MIKITFINHNDEENTFSFADEETITVGRSPDNIIQVDEGESTVSRKQFEIIETESGHLLKNIGNNPVLLNGFEVDETPVSHDDEILFGKCRIIFQIVKEDEDEDATIIIPIKKVDLDETLVIAKSDQPAKEENLHYIKVIKHGQYVESSLLKEGMELTIGRAPDNQIVLQDPEVSRSLLIVYKKDEDLYASYVGKTQIELAKRALPAGNNSTEKINIGDEITFLSYCLLFSDNNDPDTTGVKYPERLFKVEEEENTFQKAIFPGIVGEDNTYSVDIGNMTEDKKNYGLYSILVVVGLVILAGWFFFFSEGENNYGQQGNSYTTESIRNISFQKKYDTPGIINFLDPRPIMSVVSGKIMGIGFKEGDYVNEGQMLFKIESVDLEQQLKEANISFLSAKDQLRKYENWEKSPSYLTAKGNYLTVMANYRNKRDWKESQEIMETLRSINDSKANIQRRQGKVESSERLYNKGIISLNELERIKVDYGMSLSSHKNLEEKYNRQLKASKVALKKARIEKEKAEKEMDLLRKNFQTQKEIARINYEKSLKNLSRTKNFIASSVIYAEISGIINFPVGSSGKKTLLKGQTVGSDTVLAYIGDFKNVGLKVEIPESEINKIKKGQRVEIMAEIFKGKTLSGLVSDIASSATIKENASFFDVKMKINSSTGLEKTIRVGASASASIILNDAPDAMAAPILSVIDYQGQSGVLVVNENQNVNFVPVVTGISNQDYVQVSRGNLSIGMKVITEHVQEIFDTLDKKQLNFTNDSNEPPPMSQNISEAPVEAAAVGEPIAIPMNEGF